MDTLNAYGHKKGTIKHIGIAEKLPSGGWHIEGWVIDEADYGRYVDSKRAIDLLGGYTAEELAAIARP